MSVPLTYLFQDAGRILCDKVFFPTAVHLKKFFVSRTPGPPVPLTAARELDACFNGYLARPGSPPSGTSVEYDSNSIILTAQSAAHLCNFRIF